MTARTHTEAILAEHDRREAATVHPLPDPRRRTSWTAPDLLAATFPEPRWAVPGLLAEGMTFFAGPPKLGKSWFALNLCAAVASGGRALGKVAVEHGEALYLALEDSPGRLQRRLEIVLEGAPPPPGLMFETEWPRLLDGGADALEERLTRHPQCRLVAIDVFARVRTPANDRSNAYDSDYTAAMPLKALADRHRVAIVVMHHTRKAKADDFLETVSGTHGLAGAADSVLVMRRARNSADATLCVTGRDVEEAEHALRFDAGRWTLLDGPASDYDLSDERRAILDAVRANGPLRPKQIAELQGLKYDVVKHLVRRMVDADQLDTDGDGHYLQPVHSVHSVHQQTVNGDSTSKARCASATGSRRFVFVMPPPLARRRSSSRGSMSRSQRRGVPAMSTVG